MGYEGGIPYGQAAVHLFPGGNDDGRLTEPALSQHFLWFIHFILPTCYGSSLEEMGIKEVTKVEFEVYVDVDELGTHDELFRADVEFNP